MKTAQKLGIIFAIALIVFAIAFPIPQKHIRTSGYKYDIPWTDEYGEEYVGGDAYNYQMEASLKAGYMSGVLAMKSISFVGGLLLLFITLYSHIKCIAIAEQKRLITDTIQAACKRDDTKETLSQQSMENEVDNKYEQKNSMNNENNNNIVKKLNSGEEEVTSKEASLPTDSIEENDQPTKKCTVLNDKEIRCNKCGTIQPTNRLVGVCFKCGTRFSEQKVSGD